MKRLLYIFISLTTLASLTGCIYKMPTEDAICTLPNTNNPQVTRERAHTMLPLN